MARCIRSTVCTVLCTCWHALRFSLCDVVHFFVFDISLSGRSGHNQCLICVQCRICVYVWMDMGKTRAIHSCSDGDVCVCLCVIDTIPYHCVRKHVWTLNVCTYLYVASVCMCADVCAFIQFLLDSGNRRTVGFTKCQISNINDQINPTKWCSFISLSLLWPDGNQHRCPCPQNSLQNMRWWCPIDHQLAHQYNGACSPRRDSTEHTMQWELGGTAQNASTTSNHGHSSAAADKSVIGKLFNRYHELNEARLPHKRSSKTLCSSNGHSERICVLHARSPHLILGTSCRWCSDCGW